MKKHKPVAFFKFVEVYHPIRRARVMVKDYVDPGEHNGSHEPLYSREQMEDLRRRHYKATKLIARLKEALIEASTSRAAQRIATDGLCQYLGYRDHRNDPGLVSCIHGKPWRTDCPDCQAEATAAANADVRFQRAYFPMKEWRNDRKKDGQCTLKELFEFNPYEEHLKREADAIRASICPHGADLRYFGCLKCKKEAPIEGQCGQTVVALDDHRPHLCVTGESTVHVVPVALIENLVNGKVEVSKADPELIRDILRDWLTDVQMGD